MTESVGGGFGLPVRQGNGRDRSAAARFQEACERRSPSGAEAGIVTGIGDVAEGSGSDLAKTGRLRVTPVARGAGTPGAGDDLRPLLDAVDAARDKLGMRAHAILRLRLAAANEEDALRAIARKYGLNAHRVEQAEAAALDAVDRATGCSGAVRRSLHRLLSGLPRPLSVLHAEPWAAGLGDPALRRIAKAYGGLHVVEIAGEEPHLVPFAPSVWDAALKALGQALQADPDATGPAIADRVAAGIGLVEGAREPCARALLLLLREGDPLPAHAAAGHWDRFIDAVLPPGGPAVPIVSLLERFERVAPGAGVETRLRTLLDEHALALTTELYASRKGHGLPGALAREIAHRCATIAVATGGRKIWSDADLLAGLRAWRPDLPPELDALRLHRILVEHRTLHDQGGLVWSAPKAQARRKGVQERVERLLVRHGEPMRAVAVKALLGRGRSPSGLGNPRLLGRVIELGGGLWGLVDRDLPIDVAEARDLVDTAVALVRGGDGVSLADLRDALRSKPYRERIPEEPALRSLLSIRGGIAVSRAGDLRIRKAPPRLVGASMTRMIVEILRTYPEGISRDRVGRAVTKALGREPSPALLDQALRKHGVRDARRIDHWRIRPDNVARQAVGPLGRAAATDDRRHVYPGRRKAPALVRPPFDWTPRRVAILRSLAGEGAGSARIIAALGGGITKCAVISKAYRLGISVGK